MYTHYTTLHKYKFNVYNLYCRHNIDLQGNCMLHGCHCPRNPRKMSSRHFFEDIFRGLRGHFRGHFFEDIRQAYFLNNGIHSCVISNDYK